MLRNHWQKFALKFRLKRKQSSHFNRKLKFDWNKKWLHYMIWHACVCWIFKHLEEQLLIRMRCGYITDRQTEGTQTDKGKTVYPPLLLGWVIEFIAQTAKMPTNWYDQCGNITLIKKGHFVYFFSLMPEGGLIPNNGV